MNPLPKDESDRDRLVTRPDKPLPTVQDPNDRHTFPADPKPIPKKGQGNDPRAATVDYTA